jgi:hypothetical protein
MRAISGPVSFFATVVAVALSRLVCPWGASPAWGAQSFSFDYSVPRLGATPIASACAASSLTPVASAPSGSLLNKRQSSSIPSSILERRALWHLIVSKDPCCLLQRVRVLVGSQQVIVC